MTLVEWDPKARQFLRKLPRDVAHRIMRKVEEDIRVNPERYLETLVDIDVFKIRIGDYRLFVDYSKVTGILSVLSIKHRRNAYD
ncbi:MAG: type II toxin-antitoxin system RelE/ParE family toxin [Nanoarchaeota archaeon]